MLKYNSILAFGDSFIAGCELGGKDMSYYTPLLEKGEIIYRELDVLTKPYSFPNLLAQKLNIPCYNYGMTAGCNERSLRILTNVIESHPNSLVLFGYTKYTRKEFYYPLRNHELLKDEDGFVQVGAGAEQSTKKTNDINFLHEIYVKNFLHPYNNLNQISLCVESLCKYFSQRVLHLPIFAEKSDKLNVPIEFNFENKFSFELWCIFKRYKRLTGGHFEEQAHIDLAELLYKFLNEND